VEVAPGGPGVLNVSSSAEPGSHPESGRLNPILYVIALLLACACVVGGVLAVQAHQDRADAAQEQARYGDVLQSATKETEAFINIDYRKAQESIDAVAAGATGEFLKQYQESTEEVIAVLEQNKSIMDGEVVWAGVVDLDADSATVIAATTGTVANVTTDDKPVERNFRVKLDLEKVDGEWLTSNLEFVG
jgi:Mce-associated membrane protein